MNVDYKKYALFDYTSETSPKDKYRMGDVVIHNKTNEIGVIIQVHNPDEYRTDMFGNCHTDEISKATLLNILMNRPGLFG